MFLAALCLVGPLPTLHADIVISGDVHADPDDWTRHTDGYIGITGYGAVTVDSGSDLKSGFISIGDKSNSTGVVTIDGTGSTWTSFGIYVGFSGNGTLNITNGGAVSSCDPVPIGYASGSTGVMTVDGTGSTWDSWMELEVGYFGDGTLNITNGGAVSNGDGSIGCYPGSTGVVTVDGSGSTWTNGCRLCVGRGTLNITNGGTVTVAYMTLVTRREGSTGTIDFGDGGGTLTTQSLWTLPTNLTGTGTINARGLVSDLDLVFDSTRGSSHTFMLDSQPGQNITVNLDSSNPDDVGELGIGYQGNGSLSIRDGVTVNSQGGYIGYNTGATGVATVDGTGSTWNNGSYLGFNVGLHGDGTLNITNGGAVSNCRGFIGSCSGSTGVVTVDGIGSTWTNGSGIDVGSSGDGTLNITGGGDVSDGYDSRIGHRSGSVGVVTVDGTGSTWTIGQYLDVGRDGDGTLNITGGGAVTVTKHCWINSQSLLAIDVGNGSTLTISGRKVYIGGVISNKGTVRVMAGAGPTAGAAYSPISAARWSVSGTYQALGGTWDTDNHVFTVSEVESGASGAPVAIDLADKQRVLIDGGIIDWSLGVSFAATGSSTPLDFTATAISGDILEELMESGQMVLGGWELAATGGYTTGDPAYLSFDVGEGYSRSDLNLWHYDGTEWSEYAAGDLTYDGTYASFTVTGFSGYAVTAVPEPGTLVSLLIGAAILALLARPTVLVGFTQRRRGAESGIMRR
jgi:T5SS/PEP-CTERM-associated repeat protein